MKKLLAFLAGFGTGFFAANYFAKTQVGDSFASGLKERIDDAQDAFKAGFQERTAELHETIDDLKSDLRSDS